jgi:hypothetical protein
MGKTWVLKPINFKEAKQFAYITTLMENILRYKKSKKPKKSKKAKKSAKRAKNIAPKEKPYKETAIKAHISRF